MGKKKKKSKVNISSSMNLALNIVNWLYVSIILSVYVLILHDKYYDITKTKYSFFMSMSIIYVCSAFVLVIMALIVGDIIEEKNILKKMDIKRCFSGPRIMMFLFLLANIIAYFMSDNRKSSFYGDSGRFMGLATYLVIALVFFSMTKGYKASDIVYIIFGITIAFTLILAVIQHTGYDAYGLKEGIKHSQYDKFISTFGNINIFASYLVVALGVAAGVYCHADKSSNKALYIILKVIYGALHFLLGMTALMANSDSVYLGMAVVLFCNFIITYRFERVRSFMAGLVYIMLGYVAVTVWHTHMNRYPNYGGLTHKLDNVKLSVIGLVAAAILLVFTMIYEYIKKKKSIKGLNKNIVTIAILAFAFAGAIVVTIYGVKSGNELFTINYKWGTYRGYIWTKCVETFEKAPVVNKVFGFGNETIKQAVAMPNYTEMIKVTKKIYDNAHNEFLQYLITLGVFGLISYVGLVVSSLFYIARTGSKSMHAWAPFLVIIGYTVQSLVNLNQPITTPLYFVILSMGVGYAAYIRKNDGKNKEYESKN